MRFGMREVVLGSYGLALHRGAVIDLGRVVGLYLLQLIEELLGIVVAVGNQGETKRTVVGLALLDPFDSVQDRCREMLDRR